MDISKVIYCSDIADATYTVISEKEREDIMMFYVQGCEGVIGFPITRDGIASRYINFFGRKGEPVRDEIEKVIDVVCFLWRCSGGATLEDTEETCAELLGMKYGKYQEKKMRDEIQYIMKRR